MNTNGLKAIVSVAALALCGCTGFGQKFAQSDDLLELALALSGHDQVNVYPVERVSNSPGRIATAHARKDAGGVFVSGSVEKLGPGWVTTAWAHIDVLILDVEARVMRGSATSFFPSEVPATQRGTRGRSRYFARLPSITSPGSKIRVAFHNIPKSRCEFDTPVIN